MRLIGTNCPSGFAGPARAGEGPGALRGRRRCWRLGNEEPAKSPKSETPPVMHNRNACLIVRRIRSVP